MKSNYLSELEKEIDNAVELTSVCRNEWCRALETEIDHLEDAVSAVHAYEVGAYPGLVAGLSDKLNRAYRNLGPTIRI